MINNKEHVWRSAIEEFKTLIKPYVLKNAKNIAIMADKNEPASSAAKDIIRYYKLIDKSFDPFFIQLREAIASYEKLK